MVNKQKKLLFVFSVIGSGGAERFASDLVSFLIANGYDITIISLGPSRDYTFLGIPPNVIIHHFSRKSKFDFSAFNLLASLVRGGDVKEIVCMDFFSQFYFSLLRIQRKLHFNVILSLHTTRPRFFKEYLFNFLYSRLFRMDDFIVFISNNQHRYIRNIFLWNKKVGSAVIHNGIDCKKYAIDSSAALSVRTALNIDSESKIIIKVAGFRPEKDHLTALKALKALHKNYGLKAYLLFVGDGDEAIKQKLQDKTKKYHLQAYVKFLGFSTEVTSFMNCADLFTLTSKSIETFSLAALEAMACGLPIVLTEIGGASEMVKEGFNGCLCRPKDHRHIASRWYDVLARSQFDKKAIRDFQQKNFSLSKMHQEYLELFERLTSY